MLNWIRRLSPRRWVSALVLADIRDNGPIAQALRCSSDRESSLAQERQVAMEERLRSVVRSAVTASHAQGGAIWTDRQKALEPQPGIPGVPLGEGEALSSTPLERGPSRADPAGASYPKRGSTASLLNAPDRDGS